jgi:hypothetical protein
MTYEKVVTEWNSQADENHQWNTLSEEEKITYTIVCCFAETIHY